MSTLPYTCCILIVLLFIISKHLFKYISDDSDLSVSAGLRYNDLVGRGFNIQATDGKVTGIVQTATKRYTVKTKQKMDGGVHPYVLTWDPVTGINQSSGLSV